MLINIKTRHFHGSINHQEYLFHRTLITSYVRHVNIAKFSRTNFFIPHLPQASTRGVLWKEAFVEFSQNSQGSTCARASFLVCQSLICVPQACRKFPFLKIGVLEALLKKLAGWRQATLLKKRLQQRCFPVKFAKILRTPLLQNASGGCFCPSSGYICTFLKK